MYLHKDHKELFRDIVQLTSERLHIAEDIIEKDYYVSMILGILANAKYTVVFKGGTSLSKAFGVIDRFSEDIDIAFTEHLVGRANRNSRHLYDIYKLSRHVVKDNVFRILVKEVREHRMSMDEKLAPSSRDNVNIKELIQKICNEDFYKQDYQNNTMRLISDDLDYVTVRDFYREFTIDLF